MAGMQNWAWSLGRSDDVRNLRDHPAPCPLADLIPGVSHRQRRSVQLISAFAGGYGIDPRVIIDVVPDPPYLP